MASKDLPKRRYLAPWRRMLRWVRPIWPHWPLGLLLVLTGALTVLNGLHYRLAPLQELKAFSTIGHSLSGLGSTAQLILGVMLVLSGIGLFWRLSSAWVFGVLLLAVTVAVNIAHGERRGTLALSAVMLLALLVSRRHFHRRTLLGATLISLSGVFAVFTYGTFGSYLLGAGFKPPIENISTGFYYTVVTLSTVGYGDIVPAALEARMFTVSLLVVGLSIFAATVVSTLGPAISGELSRLFNPGERKMKLSDHVILVGDGQIADNTQKELVQRGIPFYRLVSPEAKVPSGDYPLLRGDASDEPLLKEANIEEARVVIASADNDGTNAFVSLAAKNLNPKLRVLAVASSARSMHLLKLARADQVFAPVAVGSRLIADLIEGNPIPAEFQDLLEG